MDRYVLDETINELTGMMIGEMGSDMLDRKDEDVLKALKVMKLAKKTIVEQNNDIEELKDRLKLMDGKLETVLHEIRRIKKEA